MTLAIGIGLCDAVRTFGAPAVLKWPNDVLSGGKKLAGVLVESQSQGSRLEAVIVGIGVNLVTDPGALAEDLTHTAITLSEACGARIEQAAFVPALLANVERWIDRYIAVGIEAIIPDWHARMAPGLAARATVDGEALVGSVHGLDLDGALLLRDDSGRVHRVRAGEVEVLRPPC
jgi:BirA family biotin operon repressor/biotin-[acetyl-CoA-carboxylase] ligase